jgi:hypothetical protein
MAIADPAPGLSPDEGSRRDTRGRIHGGGGEMVGRVSWIAVARLKETRLGLTMVADDCSREPARNPRLTARAETSSRADPVLAPINQRPSKFDGPESRPSRMGDGCRPI